MATMAQFGSLKFEITSSTALLFQNLKLSAQCETEEKTADEQGFVSAKNGKPVEVSFSILLSAALGIDVRSAVTEVLNTAQRGGQEYFYVGGGKIFPFKMMMVNAETEEIQISPAGVWVFSKLNVTLKQSSKEWITGQPQTAPVSSTGATQAVKAVVQTVNTAKTVKPASPKNTVSHLY